MVYSELFEADLEADERLKQLRIAAIELVSDSNIEEMAGYHLMLAVSTKVLIIFRIKADI